MANIESVVFTVNQRAGLMYPWDIRIQNSIFVYSQTITIHIFHNDLFWFESRFWVNALTVDAKVNTHSTFSLYSNAIAEWIRPSDSTLGDLGCE